MPRKDKDEFLAQISQSTNSFKKNIYNMKSNKVGLVDIRYINCTLIVK